MNQPTTPADRLREARLAAGYSSAAGAVAAFGWSEPTYRHHENGTRNFGAEHAKSYARAFGTSAGWLLWADDQERDKSSDGGEAECANNIRELRKQNGLTLEELADRLDLTAGQISRWETGKTDIPSSRLMELADMFGCTVDYLMMRQGDDVDQNPIKKSPSDELLAQLLAAGIAKGEIARRLSINPSAVSDLYAGRRQLQYNEGIALIAMLQAANADAALSPPDNMVAAVNRVAAALEVIGGAIWKRENLK